MIRIVFLIMGFYIGYLIGLEIGYQPIWSGIFLMGLTLAIIAPTIAMSYDRNKLRRDA